MADFWYRLSLFVIPRAFVVLARLWFFTCRIRIEGLEHRNVCEKQPSIAAFWHYSFIFLFYHFRKISSAVMVSASRDGEYVAEAARLMGHFPVRGSSGQFGVRALRSLLKHIKEGKHGAIVADGSQGPPRKAQAGVILAASRTGVPVLPAVWAANRFVTVNSWDRTVIPLPFSTIQVIYAKPISVPPSLSSEGLEHYRALLEKELNRIYAQAWQKVNKAQHDNRHR
ncbi:MAG: hypothetical protein CSA32_04415 [Desulfobulbus propionicus]|nr:MAG: hypothetical protein CSA32_04415 [Desulfobulbus propionicus]